MTQRAAQTGTANISFDITNGLKGISKTGRKLTPSERKRYGKSAMLRYFTGEPNYPVGYAQHKIPMGKSSKAQVNSLPP